MADIKDLKQFLLKEMKMTGIYQPIVIRELLKSEKGKVGLVELASVIASEEPSAIEYYVQILKAWPNKTLKKRGICHIPPRSETFAFLPEVNFKDSEKDELIEICNGKINTWLDTHKLEPDDPSGWGRMRVELITKTPRCSLCGARPTDTNDVQLDIDHIHPVSKGGTDDPKNLQVLCHMCNRAKGNMKLMSVAEAVTEYMNNSPDCVFCNLDRPTVSSDDYVVVIEDKYPVSAGHHLIIPKRHTELATDLTQVEMQSTFKKASAICESLQKTDSSIKGFNLGFNVGETAGQTVMHAHFHVIPRRDGDVPDPRGGIRGVIPGKKTYL